jgi:hypothetical protein
MGTQENKEIARRYHDLKPEDADKLLAPDFVGRWYEKPGGGYLHSWNRESHRGYLTKNQVTIRDTIHEHIADGDWVATRFTRDMVWKGKPVKAGLMHFKHIVGGRIALLWEYGPTSELTAESTL